MSDAHNDHNWRHIYIDRPLDDDYTDEELHPEDFIDHDNDQEEGEE
jgi:hypothetical protein